MIKLQSYVHENGWILYSIVKTNGLLPEQLVKIETFKPNIALADMLRLLRYCTENKIELRIV